MNTDKHELSMIAADVEAYRTDCSTPVFQMVRNMKEERDQLRAEVERLKLATFSQFARIEELKIQVSELINQRNQLLPLQSEMTNLKETHIMQLAAISVAANSNTESTLEQALKCHPDYKTVALSVVVVAIQREIWERNQKDQWRAVAEQAAAALVNCMGHVPGEHIHWKVGFKVIAAYEKQKAGK